MDLSLVCAGSAFHAQSLVYSVFHTSPIRNALSYHRLPNIHFIKHFLQIRHNLRIINDQINTSGEKQERNTLSQVATLFQAMRSGPDPQPGFKVLEGKKTFLRKQDFCLYYTFKTNFSRNNKL